MAKNQSRPIRSDVVIIGAGFSGVNMACQLKRRLGFSDIAIYDRADEIGGAWAANKYPGCAVDIPGPLYSLSWFPNPGFTRLFPPQQEILDYINRVASSCKIEPHVQLSVAWQGARWIDSSSTWLVYLQDLRTGEPFIHEAKVLISAVGGYTNPKFPYLHGLDEFEGPVVHTAQWTKQHDLRNLRVAIVGNGSELGGSATQLIPAIIDDAAGVVQFFRGTQHYVPMTIRDYEIGRKLRALFGILPGILLLMRWTLFLILETALLLFYDNQWGARMRDVTCDASREYIRRHAPVQFQSLLTAEFDFGCKRRILDKSYIKTLWNPKMRVVTAGPPSFRGKKIISASGQEFEVDFVILATGFEFTQWMQDRVIGHNNRSLRDHWNATGGIEAYQTVAMNDFPNFFYLLGPNSGSGHMSVLYAIERSAELIIKIIRPILERRVTRVEVRREYEQQWYTAIQSKLQRTVLTNGCGSQYVDPKTGWNFFSYPYSSFTLWMCSRFPNMSAWAYS